MKKLNEKAIYQMNIGKCVCYQITSKIVEL